MLAPASSHKYEYPVDPPNTVRLIVPVDSPAHNTSVDPTIEAFNKVGSVTRVVVMFTHPTPSVKVTLTVPTERPVATVPSCPLLQRKVNGVVPPVIVAVACPLDPPKQETLLSVTAVNVPPVLLPTAMVVV